MRAAGSPSAQLIGFALVTAFALGSLQVLVAGGTYACWLGGGCAIQTDWVYYSVRALVMILYAAAALALVIWGRTLASASFGMVLMSVSCAFALGTVRRTTGDWLDSHAVHAALQLPVSATSPFFAALFARELPSRSRILDRLADAGLFLGGAFSILLIAANTTAFANPFGGALAVDLRSNVVGSDYWLVTTGFGGVAMILAGFRLGFSPAASGRRARIFFGYVVGVTAVASCYTLVTNQMDDATHEAYVWSPFGQGLLLPLMILLVGSVPLVASYFMLVMGVGGRPLQLGTRRAYWSAIAVIFALALIPLSLFPWFLRGSRDLTVSEISRRDEGLVLLLLLFASAAGYVAVRRAIESVRRHHGRAPYDAFRIRSELARDIRMLAEPAQIAERFRSAVHEAFGAASRVYLRTNDNRLACSETGISRSGKVLEGMPLAASVGTPPDDIARVLLASHGWRPALTGHLLAADGRVLGAVALGQRLSELPFEEADSSFLNELFEITSEAIEHALGHYAYQPERAVARAMECEGCSRVYAPRKTSCDHCGRDLIPALLPQAFGQRNVIRRLGSGSSGRVYEGVESQTHRHVALKTFGLDNPDLRTSILTEARILAAMAPHPSIATLYGVETFEGSPVLIREFLADMLEQRMARHPLNEAEVRRLGIELCEGLAFLHEQGVLHGDIKPGNVGFGSNGHARLIDFGLARSSRASVDLDWGTPAYRSPELLKGHSPDARSDLWALSLTLYEALTGTHPWLRETQEETKAALDGAAATDPRSLGHECSEDMAVLLLAALSREPARRPGHATALLARLRGLSWPVDSDRASAAPPY